MTIGKVIKLVRNTTNRCVDNDDKVTLKRIQIYSLALLATLFSPFVGLTTFLYILVFHDILGFVADTFQATANAIA
jgi:hypothetical protein